MNTNPPTDIKSLFAQRPIHDRGSRAFTLTELLVVLASTQPGNIKAFQCLNNMRQLAQAWTLYAEDNHDRLAINSDPRVGGGWSYPDPGGGPSWITGVLDWTTQQANTNTSYLTKDKYSLLGNYLGRSTNVFACPAENFISPAQRALGWSARCRSVAMNAAVGDGYKYGEPGNPFGWTSWYVAKKSTDFHSPGPSSVWVFTDEHPDSIDDCLMYTANYATTSIIELPGSQHEGAGGVTFADGHSEIHKWHGTVARQPVKFMVRQLIACPITDPDMLWLAQHTPQN